MVQVAFVNFLFGLESHVLNSASYVIIYVPDSLV